MPIVCNSTIYLFKYSILTLQTKISHLHYKYRNIQSVKAIVTPCCRTSMKHRCILWANFRDPNAGTGGI